MKQKAILIPSYYKSNHDNNILCSLNSELDNGWKVISTTPFQITCSPSTFNSSSPEYMLGSMLVILEK